MKRVGTSECFDRRVRDAKCGFTRANLLDFEDEIFWYILKLVSTCKRLNKIKQFYFEIIEKVVFNPFTGGGVLQTFKKIPKIYYCVPKKCIQIIK